MKITLKKFAKDPKHLIKRAPLTIIINREPAYAIIPYAVYQVMKEHTPNEVIQQNAQTPVFIPNVHTYAPHLPKKRSRIWKLLFE